MATSAATQALQPITEITAAYLDVFRLRCWARAYLVEHGIMLLQEAVDGLQEAAFSTGLVDLLGQDEMQLTMGKAFEPWRGRTC
jgi:hypothetical protein